MVEVELVMDLVLFQLLMVNLEDQAVVVLQDTLHKLLGEVEVVVIHLQQVHLKVMMVVHHLLVDQLVLQLYLVVAEVLVEQEVMQEIFLEEQLEMAVLVQQMILQDQM